MNPYDYEVVTVAAGYAWDMWTVLYGMLAVWAAGVPVLGAFLYRKNRHLTPIGMAVVAGWLPLGVGALLYSVLSWLKNEASAKFFPASASKPMIGE